MKQFNREEFEKKIIAKAWKDPQFKKNLLKNPTETIQTFIKAECGKDFEIPTNMHYQIVEEHSNTFVLVLPDSPAKFESLSESELSTISGGSDVVTANCGCCRASTSIKH